MKEPRRRVRLDLALVEQGLVETRSRARDLIKRSSVLVNGVVVDRPGLTVSPDAGLELVEGTSLYVSRGGEKLAAGLDHFSFNTQGIVALDIGASTGGFTEVLLERGAGKVFAVDVGRDQLHARLRGDRRIVSLENCDARVLGAALIPEPVDAIVIDVSFISMVRAVECPTRFLRPGGWLIGLIKPQFEAGRDAVGKGGIVRDGKIQAEAVAGVVDWISKREGWRVLGVIDSPIPGKSGNKEFLLGGRYDG